MIYQLDISSINLISWLDEEEEVVADGRLGGAHQRERVSKQIKYIKAMIAGGFVFQISYFTGFINLFNLGHDSI